MVRIRTNPRPTTHRPSTGLAAGAALPTGPASAAAKAATGTITDVKHVVVLMQENRSFDHYFGRLRGVRGFGDRAAGNIPGGWDMFNQPNWGGRQYPWKLSSTPPAGGVDGETLAQCNGDLPHSWTSQHAAWNKGRMDNWVTGVGNTRTLGYLDRGDIPFHYALADNYTICDAYFWAGVSWKVYQNAQDNYGDNGLAYFKRFTDARPGDPLHDRGMGSVPKVTILADIDGTWSRRYTGHIETGTPSITG